jgi:hypothetical protein
VAGRGADGWGCGDVGLALNGQIGLGPARIDATGHFKPYLAVDDRAGRAFDISRQELAELYRDKLRGAVRQCRSTHNLTSWLSGVSLAGSQVLDSGQERGALLLVVRVLHWGGLLLASYLMIPLLLGFFPPTQGIAEGLRGPIRLAPASISSGIDKTEVPRASVQPGQASQG